MTISQAQRSPQISAVDLFCGVGGLTHGLVRGGITVTAGVDLDGACRYPYEANNSAVFLERDVKKLESRVLTKFFEGAPLTLLAGCAPCQPFSTYSRSVRNRRSDAEWELVASFGRLVCELQPHFVTMENVPSLEQHSVFKSFLKCLKDYHVTWSIVSCSSIGIPQTRNRLVLLASRFGPEELSLPMAGGSSLATVRETIGHLPNLKAGECDRHDPLHMASRLSDLNLKRIRASRPGGTWRDWNPDLRATCHRKTTGNTYPSVYGRMEWDAPSPTITTQCFGYGNGRFGHPEQNRAITLREAAMLQTFPSDYAFVRSGEKVKFSLLGRLIGNAVPVRLGEVIAQAFVKHAKHYGPMIVA